MQPYEPSYAAVVGHRLTTFMLLATIAFSLFAIGDALHAEPRDVSFEAAATLDPKAVPKGLTTFTDADAQVTIDKPSGREQRLALAAELAPLLLLIAVLWLLRGVARSVRDGDPFIRTNVRRLRAIGFLLLVGFVALEYVDTALQHALGEPYTVTNMERYVPGLQQVSNEIPGAPFLYALGAFVLAQVFAHGVELRDDVQATI